VRILNENGSRLLEGVVSVVSGGGSGIGQAVVTRFAENGAVVEFTDVNDAAVAETERKLRARGLDVTGHVADVSDAGQVAAFFDGAASRHQAIGALVNSVGIQRYGTVETTSPRLWDEVFAVNVRSMFLMAKHSVPLMRRGGGGSIVNISSVQAVASQHNVVAYTATKGAIAAMTRAMAVDHAHEGIRVNTVLPASVDTPMLRASARDINPEDPGSVIRMWGSGHPIGRVGEPPEIADVCVFLASPLASYVTGAELRVDGGLLAGVALRAPGEEG
jgi:NAD(P)-dependent dehydrogenase (short-subunit alcohol dehydrogenase family)